MKKVTLLHDPQYWSNLTAFFLEPVWQEYFNVQAIEPGRSYNKSSSIVFANFLTAEQWIAPWLDKGYRVVVDHTWDSWLQDSWIPTDNTLVLRNLNWFWYNECLWYHALNYFGYQPNRTGDKTFLMLMNKKRLHRDLIFNQLGELLPDAIYSYHGRGQSLVGETDQDTNLDTWQRFVNPAWYNKTRFSVVVETDVTSWPVLALSEKSFKPMAFKHPTITWGGSGLLQYLRQQGFVTFDHLLDESYDSIVNNNDRLTAVVDLIEQTVNAVKKDSNYFADPETSNRLEHNYNHFYNKQTVLDLIKQEIIDPIMEFSCKQ